MIEKLLQKNLTRLEILKAKTENQDFKTVNISVYRNHSFEHMEGMINRFLNQSGLHATFTYSDYDDSFNFNKLADTNHLNIIWIDFSRYNHINLYDWFSGRMALATQVLKEPILVYYTGASDIQLSNKNIVLAGSEHLEKELGSNFYDRDKFEYSGTNLSSQASIRIAQELGLKYIPSFFLTPIKAIVTDLDNTFYAGILGEDGVDRLIPNKPYQTQLKTLKDKGVLLAIASKNEQEDVKKMFDLRKDFVLSWNDFSSHEISWESKDKSIQHIAKQFNIGLESILFIDDNIGEINLVKNCYPQIKTLLADKDLSFKLGIYPLLERYVVSKEDKLRAGDIEANQQREALKATLNQDEYFKSLEMALSYSYDRAENVERAIQLLNKTNQFIFSYKRYRAEDLQKKHHIMTIGLKDKLSDSGIIGVIVAENDTHSLRIDELVISCRALGRGIENSMLNTAFQLLSNRLNTSEKIIIDFKLGPRNKPAKEWLEQYTGQPINGDSEIKTHIQPVEVNRYIKINSL